ncbi:MAG: hypothetical protein GXY67_08940 [Clostridiales bacterium]|nr:hypothetical protein [Clostridiales bacterium]
MEEKDPKPRVVNVGIQAFYEALLAQGVECAQIQWHPPAQQSEEIQSLLDMFL